MKKICAALLLLAYCLVPACNGKKQGFGADDLHLVWEYGKAGPDRSALTLRNAGSDSLPAQGWHIYLNAYDLQLSPEHSNLATAERVNGDLFRISPKPAFKALAPGASREINFLSPGVHNHTYLPGGFYLTWQNKPGQGQALQHVEWKFDQQQAGKTETALAAKIYRSNQLIADIPADQLPRIFPSPQQYRETGEVFRLDAGVAIRAQETFRREAGLLAKDLQPLLGRELNLDPKARGKAIILQQAATGGPESYRLQVRADRIVLEASAPAGMWYALQSLKILLPASNAGGKAVLVPGVEVADAPRFGHRAVMIDAARNFKTKAEVLKVLEVMGLYKLNVLHFHLNDDEGWRLEIPDLPELTEVGGRRGHTPDSKKHLPPSYGSGPDPGKHPGSGFYSRQDFIEILRFARDRHIRVIPEIETPGHARAAIKAMDARYERLLQAGLQQEAGRYLLRDLQDKSEYRSVQGWNDNVINVALPSAYAFLDKVIGEIQKMYAEAEAPLQTVHLGGDEVPAGVWQKSPAVAALMKKEASLQTTDDLWYYYFGKVNQLLKARKLYLSGWEEIGLRKTLVEGKTKMVPNPDFVAENFHTDVWLNSVGSGSEDLAYRMANAGYQVLLTNVTHFYFDLAANASFYEPGLVWGGYVDVDKPFHFIPFDYYKSLWEDARGQPVNPGIFKGKVRLTEAGKANIIGLQAPLWSETIKTPQQLEYKLLPKLLGLAERAWAPDPAWAREADPAGSAARRQAWSQFVNVLGKRELPRLDHFAGGYHYRLPTAGALVENGLVKANVELPGLLIRYTTDGREPTVNSLVYSGPISEKGTIALRVFNQAGRGGRTVKIANGL
ncbi:MAG: family 20 glycosylhydrolase [Adhaeribacter sp.]